MDSRNRKQWKCHTADSTDWNSRENAKNKTNLEHVEQNESRQQPASEDSTGKRSTAVSAGEADKGFAVAFRDAGHMLTVWFSVPVRE